MEGIALFDLDLLTTNKDTLITFAFVSEKEKFNISAFMVSETFQIMGEARYESLFEKGLAESAAEAAGVPGGIIETFKKATQTSSKTKAESTLSWVSSEKPQFTLDLLFVAYRPQIDPRFFVKRFLRATYPSGGQNGQVMTAPLGYYPNSEKGVFAITIGRWFRATNMVLTRAEFSFSRQTIETGCPLYASGTIGFEPSTMVTAEDVEGWFQGAL